MSEREQTTLERRFDELLSAVNQVGGKCDFIGEQMVKLNGKVAENTTKVALLNLQAEGTKERHRMITKAALGAFATLCVAGILYALGAQ